MDELRDYRFYTDDMAHPSPLAQEYIFQRFSECYMAEGTRKTMKKVGEITKAAKHRVMFPGSAEHRKFAQSIISKIEDLEKEQPGLDFTAEREHFT
jgi:hypothetical protein